jgi:hypothetical protein
MHRLILIDHIRGASLGNRRPSRRLRNLSKLANFWIFVIASSSLGSVKWPSVTESLERDWTWSSRSMPQTLCRCDSFVNDVVKI